MGNALGSAEALVHFRAWSAPEVAEVLRVLRRERLVMAVDQTLFEELIGYRSHEAARVFSALDADADGKVDSFEVLSTLAVWCCASWEEKCRLLFDCFDFNRKGGLLPSELSFLAVSLARAVERFAELPGDAVSVAALKAEASTAFGGLSDGSAIGAAAFAEWFESAPSARLLRVFVDKQQGPAAAIAVEATIQERMRLLEYRVAEQAEEAVQLRSTADELREEEAPAEGAQREEWDQLWGEMDDLFKKVDSATGSQREEVAELAQSLARTAASGGPQALLDPQARSQHGRLAADVEALEQDLGDMLRAGGDLLARLLRLRGSALEAERIAEEEAPGAIASRGAATDAEATRRRLRVLDREVRRRRGKRPVSKSSVAITEAGASSFGPAVHALQDRAAPAAAGEALERDAGADPEEVMAIVVAFAEFLPPATSDTQMLSLRPGDVITALGQEAQGWWYGRKSDGSEGWFPPSYVKLKEVPSTASVAPSAPAA